MGNARISRTYQILQHIYSYVLFLFSFKSSFENARGHGLQDIVYHTNLCDYTYEKAYMYVNIYIYHTYTICIYYIYAEVIKDSDGITSLCCANSNGEGGRNRTKALSLSSTCSTTLLLSGRQKNGDDCLSPGRDACNDMKVARDEFVFVAKTAP
jgi:hypothetical protein